jgi:transcriptional regulator with XRE-family HTH domain
MSPARARQRAYPTLKRWRDANDLTQRQAAAKLGISQSYYTKLELGKRVPRQPHLERILSETGVPLEVLVGVA